MSALCNAADGRQVRLDKLETASDQVDLAQASVGARAARVELEQPTQTEAATTRETLRSGLEDTDVTAAITELQKPLTTSRRRKRDSRS